MKLDQGHKLRLVFYSGGQVDSNKRIHLALSKLTGKKARSITYIPFTHENGLHYFNRFKKRYQKFGFKKFRYLAIDSDFLQKEVREALKSDVIYLAGGNTFYFLKHLRLEKYIHLTKHIKQMGVDLKKTESFELMTPFRKSQIKKIDKFKV